MKGGRTMYTPKPIDTSDVTLNEELLQLCEQLAENTHEVWAVGRVQEGWTYGPARNDEKKQTPCLVPYGELTDSERAYDRNTAMETVKLLIKLGWKITKE